MCRVKRGVYTKIAAAASHLSKAMTMHKANRSHETGSEETFEFIAHYCSIDWINKAD